MGDSALYDAVDEYHVELAAVPVRIHGVCAQVGDLVGCAAEGDQNVIRNAIYPIWDVQDYATALLGSPEETHSATGVQYVWRVGDQRLRLNVDFIVMGEGIETFTVSTGWGTDAA